MMRRSQNTFAFTLVELLVVIIILTVLIGIVLAGLNKAREIAISAKMRSDWRQYELESDVRAASVKPETGKSAEPAAARLPHATVNSFIATVDLTPRLSVGTAEPESIYEARVTAKFQAAGPVGTGSGGASACEIHLPLPPQIVSLADLTVSVNGQPSDDVSLRDTGLVWTGELPAAQPTPIEVTYSAVGRGLYALRTPPGKILDTFELQLLANGSDVRMLELSLQPTSLSRSSGQTTYAWNYKRLMFGRPIALDVLGIAPIDRLGELRWLGPMSVVAFGIVVGLYAHAHQLARFDRWMLLLVLGAFAGAYPLMYFAQEFVRLPTAVAMAAGLAFGVILVRAWAVIGLAHAMLGVVLPAGVTMAVVLLAATQPHLQGIVLTASAILFFTVAMLLLPRVQLAGNAGGTTRIADAAA